MKYTILFITLLLMVGFATATPTTQPVTVINADKVIFSATGGSGNGWFKWGATSGTNYYWQTPNQTVAGAFTDYQQGPPMISGHTYYAVACDSTGCGSQVTFAVPLATPINQTSYGAGVVSIMRGGFNLTQTLPIMVTTYTGRLGFWTWALMFFAIFSGWWMRQGDITIPMIISLVFGFMIWGAGALGSGIGVPPEAMNLGIGLVIASMAGLFFSLFSK